MADYFLKRTAEAKGSVKEKLCGNDVRNPVK